MIAAMLFALTIGVADAQQLSPDQRAILESGGRVVLTEEIAGSVWPRITVLQFVVGSPEESAAVFMDYARHASFVPNVLVSRVSRVVDAATLEVDYVLSVPIAPDESYTVRNRMSSTLSARAGDARTYRVEWTLVRASSTKAAEGEARFEPYRGGTLFTYRNLVVPGGRIAGLGFIRRRAAKDVEATAQAIAAQVATQRAGDRALLERQLRALRTVLSP